MLRGANRREHREHREQGQIVVLFAIMLVVILGFAAIVVDLGSLRRSSSVLAGAVDSGALAGGGQLPATAANVTDVTNSAVQYLNINHPDVHADSSWISYRCLIGLTGGVPDASQVPSVCDPGSPANTTFDCTVWRCGRGVAVATCVPSGTNSCNVIVVGGAKTVTYGFGPAVGVKEGSTGVISSAACRGTCGGPPDVPVDVVLIMDRTSSMSGADTTEAKSAANTIVSLYKPARQWLALGTLGPSVVGGACAAAPSSTIGTANAPADLRRWVPVGLSGTGAPNTTYAKLTAAIACYTNSSTGTDLADPIPMAAYELTRNGRTGVKKAIILETDGQPNAGVAPGPNYCAMSDAAATAAKGQGIELFTIGFGLDSDPGCPDTTGTWKGKTANDLLANMATQPKNGTSDCTAAENSDDDHYFCQPKSGDLNIIFKEVATQIAGGAHLIDLP